MDVGLLIVRVAVGLALLLQGVAKLRRSGRRDAVAYFDSIGFSPAAPLAALAALTELATGALFLSGLAVPLAAAGAIGVLSAAAAVSWRKGYWNSAGGAEYPLLFLAVVTGLGFTGAGRFSLDRALGWDRPASSIALLAVGVGVSAAAVVLVHRTRQVQRDAARAPRRTPVEAAA